ncbi:MAG: hypothetical protein J1G06_06760 [Oscillospiraceae bacterium]|nr:hypothetical protein [Oscillospiraceae bacterium]
MKKKTLCTLIAVSALTASLSGCGCSMTGDPKPTEAPVVQSAPVIYVADEYALLDGYTLYQSSDSGFSIQIPEGSAVSGEDPGNVSIEIAGAFANPDAINITKSPADQAPTAVNSVEGLLQMLQDDDSIDVTAFYVLNKNEGYEGFKYHYTSVDDPQIKGIKSYYYCADGSAYIVNATIYNGGDDSNVLAINTIVDTFISYL